MAVAAIAAALALHASLHGGGTAALVMLVLAWALLVVAASTMACASRSALHRRPDNFAATAAWGAALAWLVSGNITDINALGARLCWCAITAAFLMMAIGRGESNAVTSRDHADAGLLDCALPSWQGNDSRSRQSVPVLLASLVMLPMMCSLPLMVGLCSSAGVSPQLVTGAHFAAMFAPACLLSAQRARMASLVPWLCAALLGIGAAALLWAPPSMAWWCLALAHGAAWSLAWSLQPQTRSMLRSRHASWPGEMALPALFVLVLGAALGAFGLQALGGVHIALGAIAAVCLFPGRRACSYLSGWAIPPSSADP